MSTNVTEVEPLYTSPIGLYGFQSEGVAYCLLRDANLLVWDCGIGKTHAAMATAALLFEDGLVDHVVIVCEKNKLAEWEDDFGTYTKLTAKRYHGQSRKKLLADPPQVLISTYETIRNDAAKLVEVHKRKTKRLDPSFFCESFAGKRVLVVYDEMTKLGNRSSQNHKSHALMVRTLRDSGTCRVMGLTATPVERGPENLYNLGRVLCPEAVGTVERFEYDHVESRDIFGQVVKWKNLDLLADKLRPVLLRKRKTDADVVEQFPRRVEEVTYVDLSPQHLDFYDTVNKIFNKDEDDPSLFITLRQIAGHPGSLSRSEGQIAQAIVREVGEDALQALGSAKTARLLEYLDPLVKGQGAQVVVFSFFGQSLLPLLSEELQGAGFEVVVHHGQMTDHQREAAKAHFRAGDAQVFLTSDAGQRGINLPEASYVCVQANTPVLTAGLRWVPAWSLQPGDGIVGCDEDRAEGHGRQRARRWRLGEVTNNFTRRAECLEVMLSNGDCLMVTPEHRMIVKTAKGDADWRRADSLRVGWKVMKYLQPWRAARSFDDGWLSGMFDGEGCFSRCGRGRQLVVAQNPGMVLDKLQFLLGQTDFKFKTCDGGSSANVKRFHIIGGYGEQMRFMGMYQPIRLLERWRQLVESDERIISAIEHPTIVSVKSVGERLVSVLETSTRTFVGDGYMHHNCNYELPLTYANYIQRIDRIHRIDSQHPSITAMSFIARRTVEAGIAGLVLKRNAWSDTLLDGDADESGFVSAAHRRELLALARQR